MLISPKPALAAAAALNVVMVFMMMGVLALPVMAPAVAADTGFPPSALGVYSLAMWTAALASSSIAGELIARFGALRLVQITLALVAVGLACGATGMQVALVATAVLIGIGCGIETPASSDVLARATPAARRTIIFSLKQTGVQIGGMLAGLVFPAVLPLLGWRGAMLVLTGLVLAGAIALEPMRRRYDRRRPTPRPAVGGPTGFAFVIQTPALRRLATASFAFHCMQSCLNTFFVAYLVGEAGYTLAAAGGLLALAQFGGFVGRLGFGFLIGPRLDVTALLIALGVAMAAASAAAVLGASTLPIAAFAVLCFVFGLAASGWNGVFLAEVARESPPGQIARVTGGAMISAHVALMLGPIAFGGIAAVASMGIGYLVASAWTLAGALALIRGRGRAV
jgi:cyanate permease